MPQSGNDAMSETDKNIMLIIWRQKYNFLKIMLLTEIVCQIKTLIIIYQLIVYC